MPTPSYADAVWAAADAVRAARSAIEDAHLAALRAVAGSESEHGLDRQWQTIDGLLSRFVGTLQDVAGDDGTPS